MNQAVPLPELSDQAVLTLEHLIEEFCHHFQNHYFARHLPLQEDPPF